MDLKTKSTLAIFLAAVSCGCASVPPPLLLDARLAYINCRDGVGGKLSPAALYEAQVALDRADRAFLLQGDSEAVRDLAYIALRKSELAAVKARVEFDLGVLETSAAARRRATASAQTQALQQSERALELERRNRQSAEARLATAMRNLAEVVAVQEEPRGLVITLSGSVLFASGESTLLDSARSRLQQVAEALLAQDPAKTLLVEGHSDSRGTAAANERLSRSRAEAVREFLVSQGVDASRISAVGLGSSRPLLDNRSAENRANNRRVEIVVRSPTVSSR
jgi:outer membrane protein OmpA-like peptidoglycan-associated protein